MLAETTVKNIILTSNYINKKTECKIMEDILATILLIALIGFLILYIFVDKPRELKKVDDEEIRKIMNNSKSSDEEKKGELRELLIPFRYSVESETAKFIGFERRRQFKLRWAVFWFFIGGLPIILYILAWNFSRDRLTMNFD